MIGAGRVYSLRYEEPESKASRRRHPAGMASRNRFHAPGGLSSGVSTNETLGVRRLRACALCPPGASGYNGGAPRAAPWPRPAQHRPPRPPHQDRPLTQITPQHFVAKWRHVTVTERASSQSHFNDLCDLLGLPKPLDADPTGEWFTFETGASKASGGQGWADVWKRGCFAWEYKGKHADLDKAYGQLLLYYGALDNPPLLIVSDIDAIRIHTHFTNSVRKTYVISLDDLLQPAQARSAAQGLHRPEELRSHDTPAHVTEQAAAQFARIAQSPRRTGRSPAVAHFLIRLLFCLFAEDIGILPPDLFTRLVTRPKQNAGQFRDQLRQLFAAMAAGGYFGVETIQHVDGGLFNDDAVLLMDGDSLRTLAEVNGQDWGAIEPAIFGTLFERGLDPGKRSQQGAHFTSKEDILLIVEPVLMAPLRRRWETVRAETEALAAELAQIDAGIESDERGGGCQAAGRAREDAQQAHGALARLQAGIGRDPGP